MEHLTKIETIAVFMGWIKLPNSKAWRLMRMFEGVEIIQYDKPLLAMPYDRDWNWLMKVVDKIEATKAIGHAGNYEVIIERIDCKVQIMWGDCVCSSMGGRSKMDNVFSAVVGFIEWYNDQNK